VGLRPNRSMRARFSEGSDEVARGGGCHPPIERKRHLALQNKIRTVLSL
jgi:hypothetical protein